MSDRFGRYAVEMCRLAATQLGWRPGEFWRATPDDLLNALPRPGSADGPPTRAEIARMMEEERGG